MSRPLFEKEYNYLEQLDNDVKVKRIILEQASTEQQINDAKIAFYLAYQKLLDNLSLIQGNIIVQNLDTMVMSAKRALRDGKLRIGDGIIFLKEIKKL